MSKHSKNRFPAEGDGYLTGNLAMQCPCGKGRGHDSGKDGLDAPPVAA